MKIQWFETEFEVLSLSYREYEVPLIGPTEQHEKQTKLTAFFGSKKGRKLRKRTESPLCVVTVNFCHVAKDPIDVDLAKMSNSVRTKG